MVGELSKRVKAPSYEDDKKLDRVISYAKYVRDVPLRLKADLPPRVTVSIDAAFANRDNMKSTSGMCVTLGVGFFITSSKVQKLNSKSSTEAEIIAVSDGMSIPLWIADTIHNQCDWSRITNPASHYSRKVGLPQRERSENSGSRTISRTVKWTLSMFPRRK